MRKRDAHKLTQATAGETGREEEGKGRSQARTCFTQANCECEWIFLNEWTHTRSHTPPSLALPENELRLCRVGGCNSSSRRWRWLLINLILLHASKYIYINCKVTWVACLWFASSDMAGAVRAACAAWANVATAVSCQLCHSCHMPQTVRGRGRWRPKRLQFQSQTRRGLQCLPIEWRRPPKKQHTIYSCVRMCVCT